MPNSSIYLQDCPFQGLAERQARSVDSMRTKALEQLTARIEDNLQIALKAITGLVNVKTPAVVKRVSALVEASGTTYRYDGEPILWVGPIEFVPTEYGFNVVQTCTLLNT